jgi:hypothetical protein
MTWIVLGWIFAKSYLAQTRVQFYIRSCYVLGCEYGNVWGLKIWHNTNSWCKTLTLMSWIVTAFFGAEGLMKKTKILVKTFHPMERDFSQSPLECLLQISPKVQTTWLRFSSFPPVYWGECGSRRSLPPFRLFTVQCSSTLSSQSPSSPPISL